MDTRKNRLAVPTINALRISVKNIIIFQKKISISRAEKYMFIAWARFCNVVSNFAIVSHRLVCVMNIPLKHILIG